MSNDRGTLYVGVTNDIVRRGYEHKSDLNPKGFTAKYGLHKLVYYEVFDSIKAAIIREKQIKDMNRTEKIFLIEKFNPEFIDLYSKLQT